MHRDLTARVHFNPDRSMRLVLHGPDGPVDAGTTRRSADLGRMAQEAAAALSGPTTVAVEVLVDQPPWLHEGMIVRPEPAAVDPGEATTHPYARIVGFLPVGGVVVLHPESGAAIHPPEELVVCDPATIDGTVLDSVTRRTRTTEPAM